MEKKQFIFEDVKPDAFTYENQMVEVIPYLSYPEMTTLAHTYMLENHRASATYGENVLSAELSLMINIIDLKTNVQMYDEQGQALFGVDKLLSHIKLYEEVVSRINNYDSFRLYLGKIVDQDRLEREIAASLGETLRDIVAKVVNLIEDLSNLDLTDENIQKIRDLAEEVNQKSPIIKEAVSIFKNGDEPQPAKEKTSRKKK